MNLHLNPQPWTRIIMPQPKAFRDLTRDECLAVLARHNVGRLAFTFHDRVDIEPLNYVLLEGDLLFRTSPGSKVDVLQHHPWVAFEVDEVDGVIEWRSVVVHGVIYHVDHRGNAQERHNYAAAIERLRIDENASDEHPLTQRPILLRLHVDRLTGKEVRVG